ncbi:MAG: hypothetical protein E6Q83_16715 [Thiothrix sp.]|nr:MAG: hypothetical protein E6Q83_16715 [Thiothrix sp.]
MANEFLDSEKWGEFIALLFTIISLSNALIIFRYHVEAIIKSKNLQSLDLHVARGEATLRNLIILSYLIHKNASLLPFEESKIFITNIKSELLTLERRTLFFGLDMTTFINEGDWPTFLDQAFS